MGKLTGGIEHKRVRVECVGIRYRRHLEDYISNCYFPDLFNFCVVKQAENKEKELGVKCIFSLPFQRKLNSFDIITPLLMYIHF